MVEERRNGEEGNRGFEVWKEEGKDDENGSNCQYKN